MASYHPLASSTVVQQKAVFMDVYKYLTQKLKTVRWLKQTYTHVILPSTCFII